MKSAFAIGVLALFATTAFADHASDDASIRVRLQRWAEAFNARDANAVRELFADDLRSVVPGAPEGDKQAVCGRLRKLLEQTDRKLRYTPEIHEVLVSGDLAIVRLTWTLSILRQGKITTSQEQGMDVFRREPDGSWRIARFIAFADKDN